MKTIFLTTTLLITILSISCKKEVAEQLQPQQHEKSAYRVLAIGNGDTSMSTTMFARTETVGLASAEDSKLKAELIGYQNVNGVGVYTLAVTNKQACQVIIRWGWEELRIDSISSSSDVIHANQTDTFILRGDAKVGKIKLRAQGVDCGNSSTLIVDITSTVLPISLVHNTAKYDEQTKETMISFTIDDPAKVDWVLIQNQNKEFQWIQSLLIGCDHLTKSYSIKL